MRGAARESASADGPLQADWGGSPRGRPRRASLSTDRWGGGAWGGRRGQPCVVRTPVPWNPPEVPFTAEHVRPLGITHRRLESALRNGRIVRLRHGVYVSASAVPDDPIKAHLLRAQAAQTVAPARVASHATAALAHGLPVLWTAHVAAGAAEFSVARSVARRGRRCSAHVIRAAQLPAHHVQRKDGLLVTTPARTAVDLAALATLPEALMVLDSAQRLELTGLVGRLDRFHYENPRLALAARQPLLEAASILRGSARSSVIAAIEVAEMRRESPLESFSAGHMHLAGLPRPRLQARIVTVAGDLFPDFLWEEFRVVGEADGEGKYADASSFAREKERESLLRDVGFEVIRWTGREGFGSPDRVVERLSRALRAGGWRG